MSRPGKNYLGQAWLVLLLALVFGALLAGVQVGLEQRIEDNMRAETLSRIPELVLGLEALAGCEVSIEGEDLRILQPSGDETRLAIAESLVSGHQLFDVRQAATGERVGWVARGVGPGYADEIEVLVGLSSDAARITGLWVLSQKETPALGDGITHRDFLDRFSGAPADGRLEITKSADRGEDSASHVLAITAATISSRSVAEIVNQTIMNIRGALGPGEQQRASR